MQSANEPSERSAYSIMDILTERALREAEHNKRFAFHASELHSIKVYNVNGQTAA